MYKIEVEMEISAGHFLALDYPSPCAQQHGHNYRLKAYVASNRLNEVGMVVDFTNVKAVMKKFDHINLNKMDEFKTLNPTAENFATVLAQQIQDKLDLEMNKPMVYKIEVSETGRNLVVWEHD